MKFKTRFTRERYFSSSGDPYHIEYALQIDESGHEDLVPVGKTFIPDEINSHADSVDINVILARYANGDESALNARATNYFDATGLPNNLADMYRTVANGEYIFNQLPLDIRKKFDFSYPTFISSIGSDDFYAAFNAESPFSDGVSVSPVANVSEEVSSDES